MTYEELVNRVNLNFSNTGIYHEDFEPKPGLPLQEVNAWTYWQGMGVRNPKIVVVGQDWGSSLSAEKYFHAIDDMMANNNGIKESVQYFKYVPEIEKGLQDFTTDINLAKGLQILGYSDVIHKMYSDLFFTNLILGYRKSDRSTGGFKSSWVTNQVKEDFKDLMEILQPQIVICLGRDTFLQAIKIWGRKNGLGKQGWNDFLDELQNPFEIKLESGKSTYFFPMPHPGYFGVLNRKKSKQGKTIDDDWRKIADWMKSKSGNL